MTAREEARAALAQADSGGYNFGAFDRLTRSLRALLAEPVPTCGHEGWMSPDAQKGEIPWEFFAKHAGWVKPEPAPADEREALFEEEIKVRSVLAFNRDAEAIRAFNRILEQARSFRRQGPITDLVVVDALTAYYGEERDGWSIRKVRRMRAALEAAREAIA